MSTVNLKSKVQREKKTISEELLINLAIQGDQRAYSIIVQQYGRLLRSVIMRYLTNEEDIEETLQDTYIRMFRALPAFRRECRLSSWLCRIAISMAINRCKSRRNRLATIPSDDLPESSYGYVYSEGACQVERQEAGILLKRALSLLAAADAEVLEQFYLQELSIEEICQLTGMTNSNVKTRLMRARRRLREVVDEKFRQQLMN